MALGQTGARHPWIWLFFEGMWGGGLPTWYEVVDAELMGILVYLREVVTTTSVKSR